jgi:aminopeptidase N
MLTGPKYTLGTIVLLTLLLGGSFSLSRLPVHRDSDQPDPGVDILNYDFNIDISDTSDVIRGKALISVDLVDERTERIHLNLVADSGETGMRVSSVSIEKRTLRFRHNDDDLIVELPYWVRSKASFTLEVNYSGIPADGMIISRNKFGDRTFFGDNWPDRARHWLPTVDHPADKATCAFIITAPSRYQVVGSGRLLEETDLPGNMRRTHWATDVPLATRVMVFGAARFAVENVATVNHIPVETWVYPQNRKEGFFDYAQAEGILRFFDEEIGPFPYEKLANVQSRTRYGGMENASNIFYSGSSVTGTRSSEGLLAHEIAHQWFGDSVTEADWHHVWLSEGFATYFTQLYMEHVYGRDRLVQNMRKSAPGIFEFNDRRERSPVVDTTISDLNRLLSTNSYQKGSWILHMLRGRIGEDAFRAGIRDYYRKYRDSNAWTRDFQRIMEDASGQDLESFFEQWIFRPGYPILGGSWNYDADLGEVSVTINQSQQWDPFQLTLSVGVYPNNSGKISVSQLNFSTRDTTITIPSSSRPDRVVLDPESWLLIKNEFSR